MSPAARCWRTRVELYLDAPVRRRAVHSKTVVGPFAGQQVDVALAVSAEVHVIAHHEVAHPEAVHQDPTHE